MKMCEEERQIIFLLQENAEKGEAKSEKTISGTPRLLDSQEYLM
jgi:hypothetical protein